MFSILIRTVIFSLFALAGLWVLYAYVTEEVVAESVRDRKGDYIAQVVWQRAFPWYNGVDVYLIVLDKSGHQLMRHPLLRDYDDPATPEMAEAVAAKVHGLEWEGDALVLTRSDIVHHFPFDRPDHAPKTTKDSPGEP